jgi:hypothetical protein
LFLNLFFLMSLCGILGDNPLEIKVTSTLTLAAVFAFRVSLLDGSATALRFGVDFGGAISA